MRTAAELASRSLEKVTRFNVLLNAYESYLETLQAVEAIGEAPDELTAKATPWVKSEDRAWEEFSRLGPPLAKELAFRSAQAAERANWALAAREVFEADTLWDAEESLNSLADCDRRTDMHVAIWELRQLLAIPRREAEFFLGEVASLRECWPPVLESAEVSDTPEQPMSEVSRLMDSLDQAGVCYELATNPPADDHAIGLAYAKYSLGVQSRSLGMVASVETPQLIRESSRWYHEALDAAEKGLCQELGIEEPENGRVKTSIKADVPSTATSCMDAKSVVRTGRPEIEWSRLMPLAEMGRLLGGPESDDGARKHLRTLLGGKEEEEEHILKVSRGKARISMSWVRTTEPTAVGAFRPNSGANLPA